MGFNFITGDRDQALLPIDMREWLPADHPVWFVIDMVDQLDLSGLRRAYRPGLRRVPELSGSPDV